MTLTDALEAACSALEYDCETFWQIIVDAGDSEDQEQEHARAVIAGHAWLRRNLAEIVAAAELDKRDDVEPSPEHERKVDE